MYEEVNVAAIADEDAACVRSILAGRPERFRELVERYQDRIFATLSRYEHDRGRVEDMAQDVFVKAWLPRPHVAGNRGGSHFARGPPEDPDLRE